MLQEECIMKSLECKKCGRLVTNVGEDTSTVTCSYCTLKAVGLPEEKTRISSGKPPGWHFMNEFVDKDGNVFHKGKEKPKLKGTLPPTKISKKKIKRRTQKEIEAEKIAKYRKEKAKVK